MSKDNCMSDNELAKEYDRNLNMLNYKLACSERKLKDKENEVKELTIQNKNIQSKLDDFIELEKEYYLLRKKHDELISIVRRELHELHNSWLSDIIKEEFKNNVGLDQDKDLLLIDNKRLKENNDELSKHVEKLSHDIETLNQENSLLIQKSESLNTDNQKLVLDNEKFSDDNAKLICAIESLNNDKSALIQEKERLSDDNAKLSRRNESLSNDYSIIKKDYDRLNGSNVSDIIYNLMKCISSVQKYVFCMTNIEVVRKMVSNTLENVVSVCNAIGFNIDYRPSGSVLDDSFIGYIEDTKCDDESISGTVAYTIDLGYRYENNIFGSKRIKVCMYNSEL